MIRKQNQTIDSLELWETLAGPKSSSQWKDLRSAKECARAWLGGIGAGGFPPEVSRVLATSADFSEIQEWEAEPECLVQFDEFSGPANIDLLVTARDGSGTFVMALEAKADESFGPLLGDAFTAALERRIASPSSNGIARLEQLAVSLLPTASAGAPRAQHIRYQLLTATAAALAHARAVGASRAVLMIHEFRTSATDPKNLERNRQDLIRFLTRLGCDRPEAVFAGELVGPIAIRSAASGANTPLYVGKAVRQFA
jgi:hypothetical protein